MATVIVAIDVRWAAEGRARAHLFSYVSGARNERTRNRSSHGVGTGRGTQGVVKYGHQAEAGWPAAPPTHRSASEVPEIDLEAVHDARRHQQLQLKSQAAGTRL